MKKEMRKKMNRPKVITDVFPASNPSKT